MWCALILVFLVSGTLSQEDDERESYTCIVPPQSIIKHGSFRVQGFCDVPQPPAGEKMYSFVLKITCDPGYHLAGSFLVQCVTGKGQDRMPECLPICKRSTPEHLSCGLGFDNYESKCLLPDSGLEIQRTSRDLKCGQLYHPIRTSVVNGRVAQREEVPWFAGIYAKTTKPYMQVCGGTLVSANVVITAAHCFWSDVTKKLPAENYAVAVGKLYRPWNDPNDDATQKSDVREILIPPRFQGSGTNFQDDIAVVIVSTPFKLNSIIVPACLDFDYQFDATQLTHGRTGRVAGWGLTSEDGDPSPVLNVVELPVVDIEQCIAAIEPGFLQSITSDKICAGYTNGTAVCRGDSGGGLAFPEVISDTERYFLRGIVSTAPSNEHACNIYAVPTFTHVIRHENFIKEAMTRASSYINVRQPVAAIIDINLDQLSETLDAGFAIPLEPSKNLNTADDGFTEQLNSNTTADVKESQSQTKESQANTTSNISYLNIENGTESETNESQQNDDTLEENEDTPFISLAVEPIDSKDTESLIIEENKKKVVKSSEITTDLEQSDKIKENEDVPFISQLIDTTELNDTVFLKTEENEKTRPGDSSGIPVLVQNDKRKENDDTPFLSQKINPIDLKETYSSKIEENEKNISEDSSSVNTDLVQNNKIKENVDTPFISQIINPIDSKESDSLKLDDNNKKTTENLGGINTDIVQNNKRKEDKDTPFLSQIIKPVDAKDTYTLKNDENKKPITEDSSGIYTVLLENNKFNKKGDIPFISQLKDSTSSKDTDFFKIDDNKKTTTELSGVNTILEQEITRKIPTVLAEKEQNEQSPSLTPTTIFDQPITEKTASILEQQWVTTKQYPDYHNYHYLQTHQNWQENNKKTIVEDPSGTKTVLGQNNKFNKNEDIPFISQSIDSTNSKDTDFLKIDENKKITTELGGVNTILVQSTPIIPTVLVEKEQNEQTPSLTPTTIFDQPITEKTASILEQQWVTTNQYPDYHNYHYLQTHQNWQENNKKTIVEDPSGIKTVLVQNNKLNKNEDIPFISQIIHSTNSKDTDFLKIDENKKITTEIGGVNTILVQSTPIIPTVLVEREQNEQSPSLTPTTIFNQPITEKTASILEQQWVTTKQYPDYHNYHYLQTHQNWQENNKKTIVEDPSGTKTVIGQNNKLNKNEDIPFISQSIDSTNSKDTDFLKIDENKKITESSGVNTILVEKTTSEIPTVLAEKEQNEQSPSPTPTTIFNQPTTEKTASILEQQWVTTKQYPDYHNYHYLQTHQNWQENNRKTIVEDPSGIKTVLVQNNKFNKNEDIPFISQSIDSTNSKDTDFLKIDENKKITTELGGVNTILVQSTPIIPTVLVEREQNEQSPSLTPTTIFNQPITEKTVSILNQPWVTNQYPDYHNYHYWQPHGNWHNSHRPEHPWHHNYWDNPNNWQSHHGHQNWHNNYNHKSKPVTHGYWSGYYK